LIKSIEVQLIRIEQTQENKQSTEVQNIQVAENDVERGCQVPLYMIFPRYYACPSLATNTFQIAFEVTISVIFHDNHLVSDTLPITLYR